MRKATINRKTKETEISLNLNIDGKGEYDIATAVGFMDHMLTLFAVHSKMDLSLKCVGDTYVDYHHSVEDMGIALGMAIKEALGDCKGIIRYGTTTIPMDEALVTVALDISGRCHLSYGLHSLAYKLGDFDTELMEEFFQGFCRSLGLTLHIVQLAGKNSHHIIECTVKAFARAMRLACAIDVDFANEIPSSKGVLY